MKTNIRVVVLLTVSILAFDRSPVLGGVTKLTQDVSKSASDSRGGPGNPCFPVCYGR